MSILHPFGAFERRSPARRQGLQKSGPMGFAMIGNAKVQPEGLGRNTRISPYIPTWMSQTVSKWLPSRELTYPPKMAF